MLETDKSVAAFKTVLNLDASNVEALACLAANHFYSDQASARPYMTLRYITVQYIAFPRSTRTRRADMECNAMQCNVM